MKKLIIITLFAVLLMSACSKQEKIEYYDEGPASGQNSAKEVPASPEPESKESIEGREPAEVDKSYAEGVTFSQLDKVVLYDFSQSFEATLLQLVDVAKFDKELTEFLIDNKYVTIEEGVPDIYNTKLIEVKNVSTELEEREDGKYSFPMQIKRGDRAIVTCVLNGDEYEFFEGYDDKVKYPEERKY